MRNGVSRGSGSGAGRAGTKGGRLDRVEKSEEREHEDHSNLKFEAAMCYLRGLCYAKQNAFDRAKQCYQDAVRIDVQCFEAFDQLMKNCLLSPQEEWEFLESLDFDSILVPQGADSDAAQQTAEFLRMLYMTRLSKYKNPTEFSTAVDTLSTHYRLSKNHDIILAKADLLFTQCRFTAALELTTSILESDPYNFAVYPTHLACLHELTHTNALFLLSHRLADSHPDEPCTWLAVGVYYLSTQKIAEARRYFSKASMMDPHFGPAWIGFAHTFAAEGEHDQAISAYSTASRLFQGTHLPTLYLGMQNLQLNNLAQEYLEEAAKMCPTDPLLLNEMGVVFYHLDHLDEAIDMFNKALEESGKVEAEPRAWIGTRANLAHALRRRGLFEASLKQFDDVLRLGGRDASIFCAKGLVLLELERAWDAVCAFHEALAVQSQDPIATDLLSRALEEMAAGGGGLSGGGFGDDGYNGNAGGATTSFTSTGSNPLPVPTEFGSLGGMDGNGRRADGIGSALGHDEVDDIVKRQFGAKIPGRGARRARRLRMEGHTGQPRRSGAGLGISGPAMEDASMMEMEMSDDE
jgi:anaphase-promoting complex subunit 6